jgi:hypothetical protein
MALPALNTLNRLTSFSQEIEAIESLRQIRRSQNSSYPKISVVVSTLRPDDLTNLLKQISKQSLVQFELLIGLHAIDLDSEHKRLIAQLKKRKISVVTKKFDSTKNLGTILSNLAQLSTGEFIAKMDDDD